MAVENDSTVPSQRPGRTASDPLAELRLRPGDGVGHTPPARSSSAPLQDSPAMMSRGRRRCSGPMMSRAAARAELESAAREADLEAEARRGPCIIRHCHFLAYIDCAYKRE
jgi:hypothetical protein